MKLFKYELIFENFKEFFLEELNYFLQENFNTTIEIRYILNKEKFYLYLKDKNNSIFEFIENFSNNNNIKFSYKFIENLDDSYLFKWKEDYKPVDIDDITILPSWINNEDKKRIIIKIDPQNAFGTGHHETTILAIKCITSILKKGSYINLLDAGTGSGILSIAGFKKGIKKIVAFDNDLDAVKVAKNNFIKNKVDNFSLICGSYLCLKKNCRFDIVVANIISSILLEMKEYLKFFVKENGYLVLSGILKDEIDKFKINFNFNGFKVLEERFYNEWACIIAEKM